MTVKGPGEAGCPSAIGLEEAGSPSDDLCRHELKLGKHSLPMLVFGCRLHFSLTLSGSIIDQTNNRCLPYIRRLSEEDILGNLSENMHVIVVCDIFYCRYILINSFNK